VKTANDLDPTSRPATSGIRFPLLVTGISGVAGYNAFLALRRKFPGQVIGVRPPQTEDLFGKDIVPIDGEDSAGLSSLFREYQFGSVLNCAGNCALKPCELDPNMAHRLNVISATNIVRLSREFDSRLVHLSTDLVFSGLNGGGYLEDDPVDPVTVYGKTMSEGEDAILSTDPNAAVLRISLPMGPSHSGHAGAVDWIEYRFRNGLPATLYFDEVRSITFVEDLNDVFEWFLGHEAGGIFHLGGPKSRTLYEIAQIINRVGGYNPRLLHGCPRIDAGPMPPRAGNVSMNSDKLISTIGRNPFRTWPIPAEFHPVELDWHHHRPAHEHGSHSAIARHLYWGR
jgi:dTDP-4-dehydrorhamnose reductase